MDQVKDILGVIKRQHFWFLSPLLLIVGFVGWMMATKKLNGEFEKWKGDAAGLVSQMNSVKSFTPHPNEEYHQAMEKLISDRMDNVRAAWEKKWERQKEVLKWPSSLAPEFLAKVETMRPIETVTDRIPSTYTLAYASYIKKALPELAERIGAKWAPTASGRGGFSGTFGRREEGGASTRSNTNTGDEDAPALVEWNPGNQGMLESRFTWPAAPTTKEVLYAQEDLWVLSSLMEIIKRTNGDAVVRSQVPVKEIQDIQLGKDVTPPSKQDLKVLRPTAPPLEGEEGEEATAPTAPEPTFGPDSSSSSSGEGLPTTAPTEIDLELVKNRYYDEFYEPIADQETLLAYVTVAKRIPVRMRLVIDERHLNKLLVECANAPMTFEVQQLRFNPPVASGFLGAGAGLDLRGSAQAKKLTTDEYLNYNRTVELFGIIYVFNPVSEEVLRGEKGGELPPPAEAALPVRETVWR
ncbi:MAG: hypothetical protein KDB23_12940 [Planctomycetales bacterium]|nr:hypothetical protein [Planctomycetales bacterium]